MEKIFEVNGDKKMICPVCQGSGELEEPYKLMKKIKDQRVLDKVTMIILLHKNGYSIRQIMRFLEYKSCQSVWRIVKAYKEEIANDKKGAELK